MRASLAALAAAPVGESQLGKPPLPTSPVFPATPAPDAGREWGVPGEDLHSCSKRVSGSSDENSSLSSVSDSSTTREDPPRTVATYLPDVAAEFDVAVMFVLLRAPVEGVLPTPPGSVETRHIVMDYNSTGEWFLVRFHGWRKGPRGRLRAHVRIQRTVLDA